MNGSTVVDPNPQSETPIHIYSRLNANGTIDESSAFSNPHNYLIVPVDYNPSEAVGFADDVDIGMVGATALGGPEAGVAVGLAAMTDAFLPGHEQDLQRGQRWGIPQHETSPAFTHAASWNLGYVTQMTLLPNEAAVIGGGVLNVAEYAKLKTKNIIGLGPAPKQKLDGSMGLSETNYKAFLAGVAAAKETQKAAISQAVGSLENKILAVDLKGKTALERLRHYAAQARADAAKKPVSDEMKLHQMLIRLRQNLPSFARPPKRRGQPQNPAAAAPRGGKAQGLPGASHSSAAQNTLPGGLAPARNTGAVMQAAATPATQNVWRSSAHLPGLRRAVRDDVMPSVAPMGPANGLKARAAVRAGRSFPPFAASQTQGGGFAPIAHSHAAHAASATSGAADHPELAPPSFSEADLRQAFEDLMYHESRLPPSGTQAFDPRLSPAWAGLKLP